MTLTQPASRWSRPQGTANPRPAGARLRGAEEMETSVRRWHTLDPHPGVPKPDEQVRRRRGPATQRNHPGI
jgi:hypothetical protein